MEYTTLVNCAYMLEIALHKDRAVTHFLHRSGLINEETHGSVSDPSSMLTAHQKANLLVEDIKKKVCLNSENYHVLIRYFSENELQYKDILNILSKKYEALTQ